MADTITFLGPEAFSPSTASAELATGHRLDSGDFEGGKSGAVKVLGKLGFTVQPKPAS